MPLPTGSYPTPTPGQASRFLAQATFGPTPALIDEVRAKGYARWIDAQIAMPASQTHYDWLISRGADAQKYKENGVDEPLEATLWRAFISAPDALRVRVAFALSEIHVVGVSSLMISWPLIGAASFMDTLAAHAFSPFRALIEAVSRHPAMATMLTFRGNRAEDPRTGRRPDENYAREVMQLFTIGLYQINPDGSLKLKDGRPIPTYGNDDVQGLAKVFTGWDLDGSENDPGFYRRPLALTPANHSHSEKRFLGTAIPANTDGQLSLGHAMDTLANHPNAGPFIGTQLIQHLVTSNPSPAYIARVSAAFENDGAGRRGNLGAVVRAILLDSEAREPDLTSPTWGKVREPIVRFAAWARAFGATSTSGAWNMPDTTDPTVRLAQSPMRSPSVFNFFRPRYTPPASDLARRKLVAPEFQITDETSVAGYLNFVAIYVDRGWEDLQTSYAPQIALAHDPQALVDNVVMLLAGDAFSAHTATRIAQAVATIPADRAPARVRAAIMLTVASPEYLIQK